jgi:hypothetical protein
MGGNSGRKVKSSTRTKLQREKARLKLEKDLNQQLNSLPVGATLMVNRMRNMELPLTKAGFVSALGYDLELEFPLSEDTLLLIPDALPGRVPTKFKDLP